MNTRMGHYITQSVVGESYQAYVPTPLPPEPAIDLEKLYPTLEKATLALAEARNAQANLERHRIGLVALAQVMLYLSPFLLRR